MKHTRQFLLSAALSCALFSCSTVPDANQGKPVEEPKEALSREQAKEVITKHFDFPNVDVARIAYGYRRHRNYMGKTYEISENSDVFYKVGDRVHTTGLTELGQQYLVPEKACEVLYGNVTQPHTKQDCFCVAENIWELKEVSGISMDATGTTATVEYTVVAKMVNTFGGYKDKREGMEETRKISMKRYDDGSWRIEDEKPKYIVKPTDVPHYSRSTSNETHYR